MWHVSSLSSVATLRTAIHLLLTYLPAPWLRLQFRAIELPDVHTYAARFCAALVKTEEAFYQRSAVYVNDPLRYTVTVIRLLGHMVK